jgi:hypothetical protein
MFGLFVYFSSLVRFKHAIFLCCHRRTSFSLYTRESATTAAVLDARHPETIKTAWQDLKARPTQFIVHGFINDPSLSPWLRVTLYLKLFLYHVSFFNLFCCFFHTFFLSFIHSFILSVIFSFFFLYFF